MIQLLVIYLKATKTQTSKDTCTPMFNAASFTTAKTGEGSKCPLMDEWKKKM